MSAKLLRHTDITSAVEAARICKDSADKYDSVKDILGPNDAKLLRYCISSGHTSVLEHVVYTFEVELSRACLQEFARTRIATLSVRSSRFTLKKLLSKKVDVEALYYHTGNAMVDMASKCQMESLCELVQEKIPNDVAKYAIPDSMLTQLHVTINARSLRNLFNTRLAKDALLEYQRLAQDMWRCLPESHRVLYEDIVVLHAPALLT